MTERCLARQESDQMRCAACRLVWDTNDPEPPVCGRAKEAAAMKRYYGADQVVKSLPFKSGLPERV